MIEQLIQQLKHPDPEQRRKAIVALANAKDPTALPHLAAVYRSDPDTGLRDLALKAGRYIRQQNGDTSDDHSSTATASEPPPTPERDVELAKGYLDAAVGFHTQGDRARAIENLGKALSLNPRLQKDTFVVNLIMTMTGRSMQDALPMLIHPDKRAAFISQLGGKQKLKRQQTHGKNAETATWANVALDFGIFALVSALVTIAIMVFSIDNMRDTFESNSTSTLTSSELDTLYSAGIAFTVIFALVSGIANGIGMAVQGAATHFAATALFGGDGTLVYLYRRLVPYQTIVALIGGAIIVFMTLSNSPELLCFLMPMSLMGGTVVYYYLLSKLIGEVYNFGAGSGCGALFLGNIILGVMSFVGQYVIITILGALFNVSQ